MNVTQRRVYINTAAKSASEATYKRLGEGVTSLTPSSNSQIETKYYINSVKARIRKTSEQRQWALGLDRIDSDDANKYIYSMSEKVGDDCISSLVIFDITDNGAADSYPAKMYPIIVDVTSDSTQEGGSDITMEATLYQSGDTVEGTFVPSTGKFTPTV